MTGINEEGIAEGCMFKSGEATRLRPSFCPPRNFGELSWTTIHCTFPLETIASKPRPCGLSSSAHVLSNTIPSCKMICSSCRRTLASRFRTLAVSPPISSTSLRYASTVPATPNAGPVAAPPSISIDQATNTQSSNASDVSQSTHSSSASSTKGGKAAAKPKSSVPGGKELKGLGYTKLKPKVLALEDDEYPRWLWTLLEEKRPGATGEKVDLAGKLFSRVHDSRC